MSLWGNSDADEAKPKWLTAAQKKLVFADARGWIFKKSDNHPEEVLCAIGELATSIGQADITSIDWVSTAFDKSEGGTLSATVTFNEKVTVNTSGGTPTLSVTNGNQGSGSGRGPHLLAYASGSSTNKLTFSLAIGANNAATNAGDVLSFGANPLALNSGTIVDRAEGGNATITSAASIGTAAGTITMNSTVPTGTQIVVISPDAGTAPVLVDGQVTSAKLSADIKAFTLKSTVSSGTGGAVVDSFAGGSYRSAKYIIQVDNGAGEYETREALVVHDGTTPYITEYALVYTGSNLLGDASVQMNGTSVELVYTANSGTCDVKVIATYIDA